MGYMGSQARSNGMFNGICAIESYTEGGLWLSQWPGAVGKAMTMRENLSRQTIFSPHLSRTNRPFLPPKQAECRRFYGCGKGAEVK